MSFPVMTLMSSVSSVVSFSHLLASVFFKTQISIYWCILCHTTHIHDRSQNLVINLSCLIAARPKTANPTTGVTFWFKHCKILMDGQKYVPNIYFQLSPGHFTPLKSANRTAQTENLVFSLNAEATEGTIRLSLTQSQCMLTLKTWECREVSSVFSDFSDARL